jgi:phosphoribosylformylglycinamidine cyclo-ligase
MQRLGNVSVNEMFRTFNMGIGMVIICSETDVDVVVDVLPTSLRIGRVVDGDRRVSIK